MNERCGECSYDFRREPGFFLGSIYVNYGVTSMIVTVAYLAFFISGVLADWQRLTLCLIFAVAFPLWFHRYSRAAWLAFDYRWDGARSAPVAASNAKSSG